MLSDERLAEIAKLCQDAHLGYAAPKVYDYARDVGQLLEERQELVRELNLLRGSLAGPLLRQIESSEP